MSDQPSRAAADVLAERQRQIDGENRDAHNDDTLGFGEMARAAACYAIVGSLAGRRDEVVELSMEHGAVPVFRVKWPWEWHWWKPRNQRRDLVRAGALIIAEIERMDRALERVGDGKAKS